MKNQRLRLSNFSVLLSLLALCLLPISSEADNPPGQPLVTERYTVWLFLDPECPICQNYTLTLRNMHDNYAKRGVNFRGVYTSPVIKKREIKNFHKKYKIPFPGEIDKGSSLTERWDATVTPEVVVTSPIGQVLYQGAIDNWYYALGKNRSEPTEHYLRDALDAVLAGVSVKNKRTQAVGCLINR